MEDWQGCLTPQCQAALLCARDHVDRRGGTVITVEDFLLALLDSSPCASKFLRGSGVDMDELIRTIQCEQPIVTEVGGEGLLSSQLIYWLATARESLGTPAWLDWPQLLEVLARHAERLQGKAYVAILELVSRWPESGDSANGGVDLEQPGIEEHEAAPIVVTDPDWVELAEDVAITLAATPDALVWVRGERGGGKSSWLRSLLSSLTQPYVEMDLRREAELMVSDLAVIPVTARKPWPVLVLDNVTPADLLALMELPSGLASELVLRWQGPLVLLGPDTTGSDDSCRFLEQRLGRALETFDMLLSSVTQRKAILVAHQAAIERRWNIQLPYSAAQFAASRRSRCVSTPGGMLQWVERAAARLDLFARCGPATSVALSGQVDTLRRQSLVAIARQEPLNEIERSLEEISLLRAATEVAWHERKAAGTLRQLTLEDLRQELERWVARGAGRFTMCSIVIISMENLRVQDLEIYIRDLEAGVVSRWLESHVAQLVLDDSDVSSVIKGSARFDGDRLKITLYPQAFGKRYTSLIIEGERLPWSSDLDCARSAWPVLDTEIRCSPGEWKEGEKAEDEKWWRLDNRGEQLVVWN